MHHLTARSFCVKAIAMIIVAFTAVAARSNDIIMDWTTVKPPPAPELKPVTVDPATTGLLVLDFMKGNCETRPRCVASVPGVKKIIDAARAHNMLLIYTYVGQDR